MAYPWGDDRRYNSYSGYFRRLFGFRVQKLSVHAGFTCPNRDGTLSSGGCTFCDNAAFSPSYCTPDKSVRRQLEEGIEFHRRRYRSAERYLAYFQSFSNTYAPLERLKEVFSQAFELPEVAGIVVGTRPDCIDGPKLDYFARLAETRYVAIEYGIESCYDATLRSAHFLLGLPGQTPAMMEASFYAINSLALDTVKFHQLQLFRGTTMAAQYAADPGRFRFFSRDEYVDFFIGLLERLRPDLVVERFASEAPPRFQAGPTWGLVRNEQLWSLLERRLEQRGTWQGRLYV